MKKEHSHWPAARMEAAIELLGIKIAQIQDAIRAEEAQPNPDRAKIEQLSAKSRDLADLQDDLSPGDPRVALIRLENDSFDAALVTEEDIAFFEEWMDLAHPTPEDEATFAAYIKQGKL